MASPPKIFAAHRRLAARARRRHLQRRSGAARYMIEDMVEDILERLAFLRHEPARALIVGDWSGQLAASLSPRGVAVSRADPLPAPGEISVDEERPLPGGPYELIASLGTLDTVNDLPGALLHIHRALAPGGLMVASFAGAGSLPQLRRAMLAADGERPAPRLHPMVDVRAGGQLLQRCGFADPVIDSRGLSVRFGSLETLVDDLRAQGLQNVLERHGPSFGKAALARARAALADSADPDSRVTEHFEILTLSGWRR